jgi:hypothetical protein
MLAYQTKPLRDVPRKPGRRVTIDQIGGIPLASITRVTAKSNITRTYFGSSAERIARLYGYRNLPDHRVTIPYGKFIVLGRRQ